MILFVIPLKSDLYCQAKRDMQLRLKHLFLTVFAFSLLSLFGEFLFDNPPQMSGKILSILASPAAMGIGIIAFSLAGIFGNSASSCDADPLYSAKYKSLAWLGLLTGLLLFGEHLSEGADRYSYPTINVRLDRTFSRSLLLFGATPSHKLTQSNITGLQIRIR